MPMTLTEETLRFIREHRKDNVRNLALQAHKYPTVDVPAAIIQIVDVKLQKKKYPLGQHGKVFFTRHIFPWNNAPRK